MSELIKNPKCKGFSCIPIRVLSPRIDVIAAVVEIMRMPITRSENMSRIKSKNSKPELILRRALWSRGLRYRVHYSINRIRPDVVFVSPKLAIFVDGCQWHGCPTHYVRPRSRQDFWQDKLATNVVRDSHQTTKLQDEGWRVLRFWEHEIWEELDRVVCRIISTLQEESSESVSRWCVLNVEEIDKEKGLERRTLGLLSDLETTTEEIRTRTTSKWSRSQTRKQETTVA